ncbi:MAG: hypothetical protein Q8Q26_09420 [Pseudorhodobacter sp.]|nr:hypothetical protein [Pseudorhodobacter sp.]
MGWITAILASGPARKALGLMLAAVTIAFAACSNRWRRAAHSC